MIALNNRVHLFARPDVKDELTAFFTAILECEAAEIPGTPIMVFQFPTTASLTVDFTADALDVEQASRGAWLEVRTDDPEALQRKVLAAGLSRVDYPTVRFYFQAPGGQVWGIYES